MNHDESMRTFLDALGREVEGEVKADDMSRVLYSTDASIYQVLPHAVCLPRNADDVQAAVTLAAQHCVPVLPRAAGTSLAGQAVNAALVLDMSRHMDRILEVNVEERWVRVQPGVVLDALNRHLEAFGLRFGPDPASSAQAAMGGIVGNNATGSHSILYGMTADHVQAVKGVLADGSLVEFGPVEAEDLESHFRKPGLEGRTYRRIHGIARTHRDVILAGTPRHWRRCGGYNLDRFVDGASFRVSRDERFNLAGLVCGSEGTLAVMTEMKLGLVPRPRHVGLAVVQFPSLRAALDAASVILESDPSAVELLDNTSLRLCRQVPAYARRLDAFLEGDPHSVLLTEYHAQDAAHLTAKIQRLEVHLRNAAMAAAVVPVVGPERLHDVWTVRKAGLGLVMSMKGDLKPIPLIEDAAVPVEHLTDYVTRIEAFCRDLGTRAVYYAHASAGCLHIRPLLDLKAAGDVAKLPRIVEFSVSLLKEFGGCLSSEHGDGRARSAFNEAFFGKDLYGLFQEVKAAFDPENLLNPGNIVDAPPNTDHLRYGPDAARIPLEEQTDFSDFGGFLRAVEMCNGAGACRTAGTGTMCPSFRVTREEEHSTRGRANALRAALSGRLPAGALTSRAIYRVMDLCIECKACKSECPSSVDMTRLKLEFLAHYHRQHPVPLRTRFLADISRWNRLLSGRTAPLVNQVLSSGWFRWSMEKILGLDRKRPFPRFAREPFTRWFETRQWERRPDRPRVVLFHDTFNTYNEPEVARAAVEVLEAAGFEVELSNHGCCGRPWISKGLVDRARRAARRTVERLAPFAQQGMPVVGLEPSSLLSLRDEYLHFFPGESRVKTLADHAYLFEEYLCMLQDEGRLDLAFTDENREILFHGHCHQKALEGGESTRRALALPPGFEVEEVDAGCCGLAGAFGYEREHYEISMEMAEQRLFPAVRAAAGDTLIAAPGFSCRQQILHGTGRRALHPAQILRSALRE